MSQEKKRITLRDIAIQCGYSVNTVSRALHGDCSLPADTIARIRQSADDLGYVPNILASSLRHGRTNLIAIIIEDIQNPHYSDMISQISTHLRTHNYHVLILCSPLNRNYVQDGLALALSYNVCGIILFPRSDSQESIRQIRKNNIPLVLIDREVDDCVVDVVRCDDYSGGLLAGRTLLAQGHREFLYISGPEDNLSHKLRFKGFQDALAAQNIGLEHVRILNNDDVQNALYYNQLADLIFPTAYSAVVSFNDLYGYHILDTLTNQGCQVPEDISLISYDYVRRGHSYLPHMTSIANRTEEDIARIAVDLLLARIEDSDAAAVCRILPVTVYDEGTVCAPRDSLVAGIATNV